MISYIVKQPILNKASKLAGYELIYQQQEASTLSRTDAKVAQTIVAFFSQVEGSSFLNGKDCFLTFTPNLLMQKIPQIFDSQKLVIQFGDNVLVDPVANKLLEYYKNNGYRLAFFGFEFIKRHLDIVPIIDIIKVDCACADAQSIASVSEFAKRSGKKLFGYNVNSESAADLARFYELDYVQGSCIGLGVNSKLQVFEHMQSTFFRLLIEITKPEPELSEIANLISMDVSLSYSLLKLVNSAYFSLPNRINDIKQALTIIGLGQLKQWIYLLSFVPDGGMTDELIKLSFQRAVFSEKLARIMTTKPSIPPADAYLAGMFSTLSDLLNVSMEEALQDLPISEEVRLGLTGAENPIGDLLSLCTNYEKGKWAKIGQYAKRLGVSESIIAQQYLESVKYVNDVLGKLVGYFFE